MLMLLSLAVIGLIAYTQIREGIVGAFGTCFATLVSGMIAFEFWPTLAWEVQGFISDTFLEQMEDAIVLTLVFGVCVAVLRIGISSMARGDFGFSPRADQIGGGVFGVITGYLVSGFLVCVLQTLPWHEHFFGFEYDDSGLSPRVLPADQVWLKLMLQGNRGAFAPVGEEQNKTQDGKTIGEKTITEFPKIFGHERRYNETRKLKEPPPSPPKEKDKEKEKDKDKDKKPEPK